jgi:MoxR-like ATPase
MEATITRLLEVLSKARTEVARVIIGQQDVIDRALITIVTGQHALVEGVPGIAKTLLVRTLAQVLGCEFNRIQFTPDLMPADVTGTNVYEVAHSRFTLMRGPIFTTFLLADEVNRAPAKTQSALLQAMQERAVTIDRETYPLDPSFTVFATQNPIEYEGTYPLPEAQKDRFMLKIAMDCPGREEELLLATRMLGAEAPERVLASGAVQPVLTAADLLACRQTLEAVTVRPELLAYMVDVVRATRSSDMVLVGAGPRATQAFVLASRALAALDQRDFVTPDDVKALALSILGHRLILRPEHEIEGVTVAEVVERVLQQVAVPR